MCRQLSPTAFDGFGGGEAAVQARRLRSGS